MPSWRNNRRYILILAAASGLILIFGAIFRPDRDQGESIAPVAQADIARLQRLTVRNNVTEIARYFSDLARQLETQVLRLPAAGRSAVVWGADRVVTSAGPSRPLPLDAAEGRAAGALPVELVRFAPHRPVAAYQLAGDQRLSSNVRYPAGLYAPGVWALAAWRNESGQLEYELGQYLGPADADCDGFTGARLRLNIDLSPNMLGGAVFDANGALMGLVVNCGGDLATLDAATVEASLAAPELVEDRLAGSFGFVVGALSEDERKALGITKGVLIRQIWRGYQAAAAGLLPGDVITRLDAKPVAAAADLERMTLPVAREVFDMTIVRAGSEREVRVKARLDPAQAFGAAGVAFATSPAGLPIGAVDPAGRLAKAGVRPGDLLLRIDGQRVQSPEEVNSALADAGKRIFGVFERNGRLWGALI